MADPRRRRVYSDPRLVAYAAFTGLTAPLIALRKELRKRKRLRRGGRFEPEVAVADLAPYEGTQPHLVFWGPGYGEFIMMERVARALPAEVAVSYCLRDPNVVNDLRKSRPGLRVTHWPNESLGTTVGWLETEQPDVVVLVEQFRFPILVGAAARFGANIALINGRSRFRKGMKATLLGPFYRWQFAGFSAMVMQTEKYRQAAEPFVSRECRLVNSGDIKMDLFRPEPDADLERWLAGSTPLLVAGSTETADEERMVLRAFKKVREAVPCRLLIAPRRPLVLEGLLQSLREEGLAFSRRTERGAPAEVMVLDTMGELTRAYGLGMAAYVGGSYSPTGGGHNVLEPLMWGVPVAYGRTRGHFEAIQKLAEEQGVGTRIADADELAAFWLGFLRDDSERTRVGDLGRALLEANRGAIARTVEAIRPLIPSA